MYAGVPIAEPATVSVGDAVSCAVCASFGTDGVSGPATGTGAIFGSTPGAGATVAANASSSSGAAIRSIIAYWSGRASSKGRAMSRPRVVLVHGSATDHT